MRQKINFLAFFIPCLVLLTGMIWLREVCPFFATLGPTWLAIGMWPIYIWVNRKINPIRDENRSTANMFGLMIVTLMLGLTAGTIHRMILGHEIQLPTFQLWSFALGMIALWMWNWFILCIKTSMHERFRKNVNSLAYVKEDRLGTTPGIDIK